MQNFPKTTPNNLEFHPKKYPPQPSDLMVLHLAGLDLFATELTVHVGVQLPVVLVQLGPGYWLVALGAQGDVAGTMEAVHHVALPGDVSPARIGSV